MKEAADQAEWAVKATQEVRVARVIQADRAAPVVPAGALMEDPAVQADRAVQVVQAGALVEDRAVQAEDKTFWEDCIRTTSLTATASAVPVPPGRALRG